MKIAATGKPYKMPIEENSAAQKSETDSARPPLENLFNPDMPPSWCLPWRKISKCSPYKSKTMGNIVTIALRIIITTK